MKDNFQKPLTKKSSVGYSHHEIICDDEGNPIDYRFTNVNDSYRHPSGLSSKDLIGKTEL